MTHERKQINAMFKELRQEAVTNVSMNDIFEMKYYNQGYQVRFFQVVSKDKNKVAVKEISAKDKIPHLNIFLNLRVNFLEEAAWTIDISDSVSKRIVLNSGTRQLVKCNNEAKAA
jgi:hypothetical protein